MFGRPGLAQDYLVAALFADHLLGFNAATKTFTIPNRVVQSVRWIAGATFSLYLFHLPITQILTVISPWPLSSIQNRVLVLGRTLVISFVLAELTERKKRDMASRLFQAFSPDHPRTRSIASRLRVRSEQPNLRVRRRLLATL